MVATRKKYLIKYTLIISALLISFTLIDVLLLDVYYWRKGLGFHPEVETYEEYFGGIGDATLKVTVGTRPGIVAIEEFLHYERDTRIFTIQYELNSSGLVSSIRIINATAHIYHYSKYMGSFQTECEGLICSISASFPVGELWLFNIEGTVRAEVEVEGSSQIVPIFYSIRYRIPALSWDEAYVYPLTIIAQVIVIIILVAFIFVIRRETTPTPPPPYVLKTKTDT